MKTTETTILDKEDFINNLLNSSDYKESDICEFAYEHLQNELSLDKNIDLFINWINN